MPTYKNNATNRRLRRVGKKYESNKKGMSGYCVKKGKTKKK